MTVGKVKLQRHSQCRMVGPPHQTRVNLVMTNQIIISLDSAQYPVVFIRPPLLTVIVSSIQTILRDRLLHTGLPTRNRQLFALTLTLSALVATH